MYVPSNDLEKLLKLMKACFNFMIVKKWKGHAVIDILCDIYLQLYQ